ncbi:hypothetical protein V8G54_008370 [Vigna mungo]|uniref:Uncharacterized protein n=1 Tax=Vigna mungo TaxID=3915 RepID=A0AAQ3S961_VIGMU
MPPKTPNSMVVATTPPSSPSSRHSVPPQQPRPMLEGWRFYWVNEDNGLLVLPLTVVIMEWVIGAEQGIGGCEKMARFGDDMALCVFLVLVHIAKGLGVLGLLYDLAARRWGIGEKEMNAWAERGKMKMVEEGLGYERNLWSCNVEGSKRQGLRMVEDWMMKSHINHIQQSYISIHNTAMYPTSENQEIKCNKQAHRPMMIGVEGNTYLLKLGDLQRWIAFWLNFALPVTPFLQMKLYFLFFVVLGTKLLQWKLANQVEAKWFFCHVRGDGVCEMIRWESRWWKGIMEDEDDGPRSLLFHSSLCSVYPSQSRLSSPPHSPLPNRTTSANPIVPANTDSVETGLLGQCRNWASGPKLGLWTSVETGLMGQCMNWAYGPMCELGLWARRNWAYGPMWKLGLWANKLDLWARRNWAYGPMWKLGLWANKLGLVGQCRNWAYGPVWKLGLWANCRNWAYGPDETGLMGQCGNWAYGPMCELGLVGQCRNWAYGILKLPDETGLLKCLKFPDETGLLKFWNCQLRQGFLKFLNL